MPCKPLAISLRKLAPADVPEAPEREVYFPLAMPASLIASLGRERFLANRDKMDLVVQSCCWRS